MWKRDTRIPFFEKTVADFETECTMDIFSSSCKYDRIAYSSDSIFNGSSQRLYARLSKKSYLPNFYCVLTQKRASIPLVIVELLSHCLAGTDNPTAEVG